jgi:hypothetical protein
MRSKSEHDVCRRSLIREQLQLCSFVHELITYARLSLFEIFRCVRDRSKLVLNLSVILSHSLRIIDDMFSIRIRYRVCVCNWFKCKSMKTICVLISRIETNVTRKVWKILWRHMF